MVVVRAMRQEDWPAVVRIYSEGLATGTASFETALPDWEHWDASHLAGGRLVAVLDGQVGGWAAMSPVSSRVCYAGVAEVSIYVGKEFRGQGLGKTLLAALVGESERMGLWTLQAVILAENEASLSLHQQAGFRVVGRRERIAQRDGAWHDTILLERRSKKIN